MHQKITPLADLYRLNDMLFAKAFDGVKDEDVAARPMEAGNSLHYIAGHITGARYQLARLLGVGEEFPFGTLFNAKQVTPRDPSEYPPISKIQEAWKHISDKLYARMEAMTEEDLAAKSPLDLPVNDNTLASAIAFLSLHESYHVGQLSYIRRLYGYDGLAG